MKILDTCTNFFGNIDDKIKKRIQLYFKNPTCKRWDDIQSIIISPSKTIWQALVDYDCTFPKTGRGYDANGKVVKEWERIPDPWDVMKAIQLNNKI